MTPILAESTEYPAITITVFGAVVAGVIWLWLHFKKADKDKDTRMISLEGRMNKLETAVSGQSQFVSAVVGASKAGDSVASKVIHDLHDQYKPTDRSGTYHPIRVK